MLVTWYKLPVVRRVGAGDLGYRGGPAAEIPYRVPVYLRCETVLGCSHHTREGIM